MKKSKEQSKSTLNQLIFLILVFILGIILLIGLHLVFQNLIYKIDQKTENQKAKIEIGQLIINDLIKIKSDFYELATISTNKESRKLLTNEVNSYIQSIKNKLDVLNNGGEIKTLINLNILNNSTITKTIVYKNESKQISLESIDITPKLIQLKSMINSIDSMIEKAEIYFKNDDYIKYSKQVKKIKRFYKKTPAFFGRLIENTNRLQYEGQNNLKELENRIILEKSQYEKLEIFLIIFILVIVVLLGFIIAKQIIAATKNLEIQETYTRGVLDGQPNIVVVSNGKKMIDANTALVDFFDGYDSFEDFKKKHLCICDFFIDINDPQYIINKDYDGKMWYEYIIDNPNMLHKVAMESKGKLRYFSIIANQKQIDETNKYIIISLSDISKEIEFQKNLKEFNENLEGIVKDKTRELTELNETLEQKITLEVEKNREKDKKIIQQTRFAALGEMIGNIAHQWRQPLSAISSTASSTAVQIDLNIANEKDIRKSLSNILNYISFLTQTIEDFRSFFKEDKQRVNFDMINIYKNTKTIANASYADYQIKIFENKNCETLMSNGFPNELSQVILNILNNAKDILLEKVSKNRVVYVEFKETNNANIVTISDNAGGINEDIKDKIFDPYFTTKHQSQGTGIGLYMSKEIIEKHMKGTLNAYNKDFKIDDKNYHGACFEIKLPKI